MQEYNTGEEYGRTEEKSDGEREFNATESNEEGKESQTPSEQQDAPVKKKVGGKMRIMSFFAAVGAVAVVGVGQLFPTAKAEIVDVYATDSVIEWCVNVEKADGPVKIVAYNDFTEREITLRAGENKGTFENLQEGMPYKLAVKTAGSFGEKTIAETAVSTRLYDSLVTEIKSVSSICTCNVDGYFHFIIDFIDEKGILYDFEATLTDADGKQSACKFGSDIHKPQRISVTKANLTGDSATFLLKCKKKTEGETGYETVILFDGEVKI